MLKILVVLVVLFCVKAFSIDSSNNEPQQPEPESAGRIIVQVE